MNGRHPVRFVGGSLLLALGMTLALAGCNQPQGQGPGGRTQHLALTPEQEEKLGTQAYKEVLADPKIRRSGGKDLAQVERVGGKIAAAARIEPLLREMNLHVDDKYLKWQYTVIEDDKTVNAFCLPGGKVAVYTGLLRLVDSDDELAAVMGHEAAHALAHHSSERLYRQEKQQQAVAAANKGLGKLGESERKFLIGLLSAGAQVRGLSYDRAQEAEADHVGLFLMTFAGYNPEKALTFWEKMSKASHGSKPQILSDHPSNASRIAEIRKWIPRAKGGLAAYKAGRIKGASR